MFIIHASDLQPGPDNDNIFRHSPECSNLLAKPIIVNGKNQLLRGSACLLPLQSHFKDLETKIITEGRREGVRCVLSRESAQNMR